mgnify:CR=1 FL=1
MKDFDLKTFISKNPLLEEHLIKTGRYKDFIKPNKMKKSQLTIPGFDVDAFRQYMNDGSGEYSEQEVQDLISQAEIMVIRKLFNK